MNRTMGIGIGVIVLLVVGGLAYVVLPAVYPTNSMTISFYDADDNLVQSTTTALSLWPWAFADAAGKEVTKVVVTVDYDTAFTGAGSPTGVHVGCKLTRTVKLNTYTGGIVNGPLEESKTSGLSKGTFTFTYVLSQLISPVESGKACGWGITFEAELTGTAVLDEVLVTATPWTDSISAIVEWDEVELSMFFVDAYIGELLTP